MTSPVSQRRQQDSLADILERVLDKGVVIAGDIVVNVLDLELLSLKLRLFVASAQTAREMGMDWWTTDPFFSPAARPAVEGDEVDEERRRLRAENEELRDQLAELRKHVLGDQPRRAGIESQPAPRQERSRP